MVAIIDVGLSNISSVERALNRIGVQARIVQTAEELNQPDHIILPGVGAFAEASKRLADSGMDVAIRSIAENGTPLLGICLGMHLLGDSGTEGGEADGLGLIPGRVEKLPIASAKVRLPHMGWNAVSTNDEQLFAGIPDDMHFYFVHSYHFVAAPDACAATTAHGITFTSVVRRDNIIGTQFHPEKSQALGLRLLRNFVEL
jgi:imidazole glycerol-phosphate synthase subunit HisH